MISRLLNEVVASAGVEIRTSGDCHILSEIITQRTGKVVNYNTLRRMYGLAKPVKPSRSSLDILSEFVGFDSYLHFTSGAPRLYSTRTKEEVYLHFAKGQDTEAVALLREMPESTMRSDAVIQMGRELFVSGQTDRALSFLELAEPLVAELPYSEIVHVGNSIGIARSTLASVSGLINHHSYQRLVHSLFVDYPHFSGYYGAEVDALKPGRAHSPEFELVHHMSGHASQLPVGPSVGGGPPRSAPCTGHPSHPPGAVVCVSHDVRDAQLPSRRLGSVLRRGRIVGHQSGVCTRTVLVCGHVQQRQAGPLVH